MRTETTAAPAEIVNAERQGKPEPRANEEYSKQEMTRPAEAERANEAKQIAEPISRFAQRRAQLDNQQATQSRDQQREEGAAFSRFAERRKADQSSHRFQAPPEQSDFRQRRTAREEQRPAPEATEARTSRTNNSDTKQNDKDSNER